MGPGDPELMTLQAVRVIRECDLILAPGKEPRETVAWKIAAGAVPGLEEKEALGIHMPMTRDPKTRQEAHEAAAERIVQELAKGRRTAFLTLGDPCIYSTYLYVHKRVQDAGYRAGRSSAASPPLSPPPRPWGRALWRTTRCFTWFPRLLPGR